MEAKMQMLTFWELKGVAEQPTTQLAMVRDRAPTAMLLRRSILQVEMAMEEAFIASRGNIRTAAEDQLDMIIAELRAVNQVLWDKHTNKQTYI